MLAVINVDTYPFLAFSDLTYHLEDTGIGCAVPLDSKESGLGSSDQEASPSAGKNIVIVFVSYCAWTCVPITIFSAEDIYKVPGYHFFRQMNSQ